ncbi:MAG: nucleotidyltransferase domain-containing protein [Leptolyngbya sp. DLM2.Bin15]|nr:MAG: nucleotidyltransferase domain-containing protein [Leptolyngbya sp. DLM2.Bin15]
MKHPKLDVILNAVKDYLKILYSDRLQNIILYGSQARADSHLDSDIDIDILVVLDNLTNPYLEIDKTGDFIAHLCLEYDIVISRHFISSDKFTSGQNPFLENIRNEGIVL